MAVELNQDEILLLFRQGLSPSEFAEFILKEKQIGRSFKNIDEFEKYLLKRTFDPEQPYYLFDMDIAVCRFFETGYGAKILDALKRKNEEMGFGKIEIPNTKITLINYSYCPKCQTVYSFKEVLSYYKNFKPDAEYKRRVLRYRNDTKVYCGVCNTYFLPSVIISDGTPKDEIQFLFRAETMRVIEEYFLQKGIMVLGKREENIIHDGYLRAVKNDVLLRDLEKKPTLIANMLQYTPLNLLQNLIDGTNAGKEDLLFDEWNYDAPDDCDTRYGTYDSINGNEE